MEERKDSISGAFLFGISFSASWSRASPHSWTARVWRTSLASLLLAFTAWAQEPVERPYVVLVSLDGFRYDYAARYGARNLLELGREGASAQALIPSFPSLTFPNHLSIVTGMYPEHHGIVANTFIDLATNQTFTLAKSAEFGRLMKAKPIWLIAEEQGVKAASMFWPMSDAEGLQPTYWKPFDEHFPNDERIRTVLNWLKLPPDQRPHFITLYFSDVDHAGHDFGPDAPETREAVQRVDALVGSLRDGIRATGLPVNLIVVSDHGMQAVEGKIDLNELADLSKVRVANNGPFALTYAQDSATRQSVYQSLKKYPAKVQVYRRQETPAQWHYSENPLSGDIFVMANASMALVTSASARVNKGQHGLDPTKFPLMRGIFYAAGPNIRPGAHLQPFTNVNIFSFMAEILDLRTPPGLDGSVAPLRKALRTPAIRH